ncbi:MAG: chemotaxis protein CheW [Fibrobacterota bacterium]
MADQQDDVYQLFLEESLEYMEEVEKDLLAMEENKTSDPEQINRVFRAVHTIKGGAGFFNLTKVKTLAHTMENILGDVREENTPVTDALVSELLKGADLLGDLLKAPENEENCDISEITATIEQIHSTGSSSVSPRETDSDSEEVFFLDPHKNIFLKTDKTLLISAQEKSPGGPHLYCTVYNLKKDILDPGHTLETLLGAFESLIAVPTLTISGDRTAEEIKNIPEKETPYVQICMICATVLEPDIFYDAAQLSPEKGVHFIAKPVTEEDIPREIFLRVEKTAPPENTAVTKKKQKKTQRKKRSEKTIRIALSSIDTLMNLASELVLTRNEFLDKTAKKNTKNLSDTAHRLDKITGEVQEVIMQTRMQSVGMVFDKFKRVVRDLSKKVKKEIDLTITGSDVELDRTIVEAIKDPLTHLVRNSIDHGIETPRERIAAGKGKTGHIHMSAVKQTNSVRIEIQDDGAGIDPEKIGAAAVEKGIIEAPQLDKMSKEDIIQLIFYPGFSTAGEITDISGRGVGMDVVYNSLTAVGGKVDITSERGTGTTITIGLPLTLSIVSTILVDVQGQKIAIPQNNVVKLMRIKPREKETMLFTVGESTVLSFQDRLIPVAQLSSILNMPSRQIHSNGEVFQERRRRIADRRSPDLLSEEKISSHTHERRQQDRRKSDDSITRIVVIESEHSLYGVIVDTLEDSEEIVVKPLGYHFKNCKQYAGSTILGDGNLALILDIDSAAQSPEINSPARAMEKIPEEVRTEKFDDYHAMLTFSNENDPTWYAVPMDIVRRIHRIDADTIETVGKTRIIQYKDETIPLIFPDAVLDCPPLPEKREYHTLLFTLNDITLGLVVTSVHDIQTVSGEIDTRTHRKTGTMGTMPIAGKITVIIDLYQMVKTALPDAICEVSARDAQTDYTVLVVDDSAFFRNQMTSIVADLQYTPLSAKDGQEALDHLSSRDDIDLVLTDIEMPRMNGIELTKQIRTMDAYSDIPIIACTTLSSVSDQEKGLKAGINDYLIKIDRNQIVQCCKKYLS